MKIEVAEQLKNMVSEEAEKEISAEYIAQHALRHPDDDGYEIWTLEIGGYDDSDWEGVSCHITIRLNIEDPSKSEVDHYFVNPDSDYDCLSWM